MNHPREALVLVDHGSRAEAANETLEEIAGLLRKARPDQLVIVAHMELAPPTLAEAVARCAAEGAQRVTVMPYFLAPGRHTTRDIPELVREVAGAHPELEVLLAPPLGVHAKLVEVILDRLAEARDPGVA